MATSQKREDRDLSSCGAADLHKYRYVTSEEKTVHLELEKNPQQHPPKKSKFFKKLIIKTITAVKSTSGSAFQKTPHLNNLREHPIGKVFGEFDNLKHPKSTIILHYRKGINMYQLDTLTILSTCCVREVKVMFIKTMTKFPSFNRQLSDYWPLEY